MVTSISTITKLNRPLNDGEQTRDWKYDGATPFI